MGRHSADSAPPLVGRDGELDRLTGAVSRLDRGLPALVEVVAEPGMGKSALLAALVSMLGERPVLRARATELERATPCGVLARAIETAGSRADGVVRQLLGTDANTVGIPRHETYRDVRALLGELAEPAGLALVLDDMHWADGDSLALLDYLLDVRPADGMLVAVAYRPRQVPVRLLGALTKPEAAPGRERVELGPLDVPDATRLVRAAGQDEPSDAILTAGGGNPLYLLALAHAPDVPTDPVPGRLRAALLSDVDAASAAAQHLARAAAVVGDPFDPDVVVEVAGLDRPAATAALDELHRRDVLRPESTTLLRFRHPLLRRMIYDAAPPAWRRTAHRTAITALRWRGASVLAEAAHLELCASRGDLDAVDVLLAAADQAGPRAPASAARWLRGALELLPDNESTSLRWLDRRIQLARHLVLAGQFTEARAELLAVAGHLPIAPDPRRTAVVVLRATVERLLGNHNDGRRQLVAELALTVPDTVAHAELTLELATVELTEGTASAHTVELATRAAAASSGAVRACAHAVAAAACHLLGDLDPAFTHADAAARELDALPDEELTHRLDACVWTAWVENTLGRFLPAVAHFDRGIGLGTHTGQAHVLCHLLAGRAIGERWLGRLPAALTDADQAVDVARVCRSDELLALTMATRARVALPGGDVAAARSDADTAVRLAGPDTGWWATMTAYIAALARTEAGEPAGPALLAAGGGAALPRVDPFGRPAWYALLARTSTDRALARSLAARADEWVDDRLPLGAGFAALARAEADRDEQAARAAVDLFGAAGAPVEAATATVVLAECLAAAGKSAAARRLHERAADTFAACGAQQAAERARRAASGGALSPRELQVATLVSRGCTNKQIAEQLFVTEKTVETHLSRIFTKLGVSSRAALAAWAVASPD